MTEQEARESLQRGEIIEGDHGTVVCGSSYQNGTICMSTDLDDLIEFESFDVFWSKYKSYTWEIMK